MIKNQRIFWRRFSCILTVFIILGISNIASATHFRGGQISWTIPNPTSPLTVEFTITQNWRHSANGCENLNFGDSTFGTGCNSVVTIGTGTDVGGRVYSVNQHTETHTYASAGEYTASFQNCCRLSDLANGADGSFKVQSVVALGNGNGGGPNVSLAAVNTLQIGDVRTIDIPAVDPDGDSVSCRFATDAETLIGPSIPSVNGSSPSISSTNNICTISWDLTSVTVAGEIPYVMSLVFESERGGVKSTTQADTTVILSSSTVAVPVCSGSASFSAPVGVPFTHKMVGTKTGESLTVSSIGAPSGSTLTPSSGSTGASPMDVFFRWTPTPADSNSTKAVIVRFSDGAQAQGDCLLTLTVPKKDSDGDRLPDDWESSGVFEGLNLSEAHFGGLNEPETASISDFNGVPYAPDVFKKDVYLWLDVIPPTQLAGSLKDDYPRLKDEAVLMVQRAFQLHGVNLHINLNRITYKAFDDSGLSRDLNFGINLDLNAYREAFGFNSIKTANNKPVRASVYRYAVYGHQYFFPGNAALSTSSGLASIYKSSIAIAGGIVPSKTISQAGTLMHELGHLLGLGEGGPKYIYDSTTGQNYNSHSATKTDEANDTDLSWKPNYLSVMNYAYQFNGLIANSKKYQVDYASFAIGDVNESTLLFENIPPTNDDTSKRWAYDQVGGPIIPTEIRSLTYGTRVRCNHKNVNNFEKVVNISDISDYRSDDKNLGDRGIFSTWSKTCENFNDNDINDDKKGPHILHSYSDWDNMVYFLGGIGEGLGVTSGLPTSNLALPVNGIISEPPADELYIASEYEVSVDILDSDRNTTSPATLQQQFTVHNSGFKPDTYDLTLFSYSQWAVSIVGDNKLTLAPGESKVVTVSIDVPSGLADLHQDTVKLRAESDTTFDSKEVVITVDATAPVDSDGDGLSDVDESTAGTNPNLPDTDGDGFNDAIDPTPLVADTLIVDAFSIPPKLEVAAETIIASTTFVFTGATQEVPISIVGGEYSIDGGTTFTHLPGMVEAGQSIMARTVSSPVAGDETNALVNIGGETALFKVVTSDPNAVVETVRSFSDTLPSGATGTLSFTSTDASCTFDTSTQAFFDVSLATITPQTGLSFVDGLISFEIVNCAIGATVNITMDYAQAIPDNATYWKEATPWYLLPSTISGTTVNFSITDGGVGDADGTADGTISDPSGLAIVNPQAVPTLSQWSLILLILLMLGSMVYYQRRRMY